MTVEINQKYISQSSAKLSTIQKLAKNYHHPRHVLAVLPTPSLTKKWDLGPKPTNNHKVNFSLKNSILIWMKHFLFKLLLFSEVKEALNRIYTKVKTSDTLYFDLPFFLSLHIPIKIWLSCLFRSSFYSSFQHSNCYLYSTGCPKKVGYWNWYFFSSYFISI